MPKITGPVLSFLLLAPGHLLAAGDDAPLTFSSGEHRTTLIELYTSEGCSSCPPADRWLSSLESETGLWTDFIPVAFHVDYWDYIGWKDRFARARYSERQRRFAAAGKARFVYTPGVFRNGREWRGWRTGRIAGTARPTAGVLTLTVDGADVAVKFDDGHARHPELTAQLAVLGMNLETRVLAGENEGRTLRHDFVALGVATVAMTRSGGVYAATARLPEVETTPPQRAIAAWISKTGQQTPIQSVGGYLQRRQDSVSSRSGTVRSIRRAD